MKAHHKRLFEQVRSEQMDPPLDTSAAIDLAAVIQRWLAAGPAVQGEGRHDLDAVCRLIDVRKKISTAYSEGWRNLASAQPAAPRLVSGLVAVLLANGSAALADDSGWSLKCVNSALKALDMYVEVPHRPALQAWAWEILDLAQRSDSRP